MPYATLMVHVDGTEDSERRVSLASDLAMLFDAKLIGIGASLAETVPMGPEVTGPMVGEMLTLQRDSAKHDMKMLESQFRSTAGRRLRDIEWRSAFDSPSAFIIHESRAADLLIVGRDLKPEAAGGLVHPGDIILSTGRPVLVVPSDISVEPLNLHIVIAWKETRESRRAVADALPFLQNGSRATVLSICENDRMEEAWAQTRDVVAYLERHKAHAKAVVLPKSEDNVADRVMQFAHHEKAGLVVMGGYGYGRLREWAFGGATRDMLERGTISCLFSH